LLIERDRPEEAFAVFYRRHVQTVLRLCARRRLNAAEAADVTAETFAAALLARRRYRAELGAARAWLLGIAANKLADHARRLAREQRAQRRLGMQPCEHTDHDLADFEALLDGLEGPALAALGELPATQAAAVYARVVEEEEYVNIGHRLQISEARVRQRVSRGLARLRAQLSKEPS
jgi:RNA polymerase sigma-70 factor (ECF subfamily)